MGFRWSRRGILQAGAAVSLGVFGGKHALASPAFHTNRSRARAR